MTTERCRLRADEVKAGDVFVAKLGGKPSRERTFPVVSVGTWDGMVLIELGSFSPGIDTIVSHEKPAKRMWIDRVVTE